MGHTTLDSGRVLHKLGIPAADTEDKTWGQQGRDAIVQFICSYDGDKICSLQFQYLEDNGNLVMSEIFGNPIFVGSGFHAVTIDYPSEYITGVRGWYNSSYVEELTIFTNKKEVTVGSSLYPKKRFQYKLGNFNQFGGFYGTNDSYYIKFVGVYFKPITKRPLKDEDPTSSTETTATPG